MTLFVVCVGHSVMSRFDPSSSTVASCCDKTRIVNQSLTFIHVNDASVSVIKDFVELVHVT